MDFKLFRKCGFLLEATDNYTDVFTTDGMFKTLACRIVKRTMSDGTYVYDILSEFIKPNNISIVEVERYFLEKYHGGIYNCNVFEG